MCKLSLVLLLLASLVMPVLTLAQGTIGYDQVIAGQITSEVPEVRYSFAGAAGDIITIHMTATEQGLDSYLELFGPNGESLSINDDSAGSLNSLLGPITLPESGSYTIVATRCCGGQGGSVGPYELVIRRVQVAPLTIGETVTVDLGDSQPAVYFSLAGSGQSVLSLVGATVAGDTNVVIEIRDPSGVIINSGWQINNAPVLIDPLVLGMDGSYLITVNRQQNNDPLAPPPSGNVSFSLTLQTAATQPIEIGGTVSGTLDDSNPSDHYLFNGTPDDLLRLSGVHSPDGEAFEVIVYAPNGLSINGTNTGYVEPLGSFTLDPLQLFEAGQYLLLVRRLDVEGDGIMGASGYTLTLGVSESPTLHPGVETQGTVGGQTFERVFRYQGAAGQTIRITLRSLSDSYAPALSVQGPNVQTVAPADGMGGGSFVLNISSSIPGTVTYEVTLPQNGTYLFRVNNGAFSPEGPAVGDFSLLIEVIG